MKQLILKNWMTAVLLAGVCAGFVACDDDNDGGTPPPTDPDVTAVVGKYTGTMSIVGIVPAEGGEEGEEPTVTPIDATATGDEIQFTDFPIRDLVVKVLGDETLADQIVEKVGKVDYSVPYTAVMGEDKTSVRLTLIPEPLKLTLADNSEGGETTTFEEPSSVEIEVTITAEAEGVYTVESKKFKFKLSATGVKIDAVELPGFEPFSLEFDLTKN